MGLALRLILEIVLRLVFILDLTLVLIAVLTVLIILYYIAFNSLLLIQLLHCNAY